MRQRRAAPTGPTGVVATTVWRRPTTSRLRDLLLRHQLVAFFALAYGVSWALLLACRTVLGVPQAAILIQTLGPTVAARILLTAEGGRPRYAAMRIRARTWRVPVRWYVIALVGIPAACLLAIVALPGGADALEHTAPAAMASTFLFYLVFGFFSGPLFEEPGWRGYALPRLQSMAGPLVGTLVLGILWGAWHLPQFLVPEWAAENGGSDPGTIGLFLLLVLTLAPLLTWVYNGTRGSLFLAMVTHSSINASLAIVPAFGPGPMVVGVVAFGVIAVVLIVATRGRLGYDAAVKL